MSDLCLVTGANGHLGNNLVRALLAKGMRVRAGVRDKNNTQPFADLDCELVYAEMQDQESIRLALQNVDVLYQVAAVFKHWAKDPEAEIVIPNVNGTRIVLEAAAQAGVRKVVYVSSVAAIGHDGQPLDESHWNPDLSNPYYRSKILSELHAWQVAQQHGLWMVSILPSAMIGPNAQQLTDTMGFLESIRHRQLPVNPNFHFNFIDVRDVAEGAILAAEKGQAGQRYILANTHSSDFGALIEAANSLPRSYTTPPTAPKWLLLTAAWASELLARVSGKPAKLTRSQVRLFHGVKQEYQTDKAQSQLGFQPRSPALALEEAFAYLERRAS